MTRPRLTWFVSAAAVPVAASALWWLGAALAVACDLAGSDPAVLSTRYADKGPALLGLFMLSPFWVALLVAECRALFRGDRASAGLIGGVSGVLAGLGLIPCAVGLLSLSGVLAPRRPFPDWASLGWPVAAVLGLALASAGHLHWFRALGRSQHPGRANAPAATGGARIDETG